MNRPSGRASSTPVRLNSFRWNDKRRGRASQGTGDLPGHDPFRPRCGDPIQNQEPRGLGQGGQDRHLFLCLGFGHGPPSSGWFRINGT